MKDELISTKYDGVYYKELKTLINGKPDLSYYVMYRSHGKQIKKSVGKKSLRMTPAKASQIRLDILYEIKHGINAHNSKSMTLLELADIWKKDKEKTIKSAKYEYNRLMMHCQSILNKKVINIKVIDMKNIYHEMLENELSELTFKKVYMLVKRVIKYGLEHEYINQAPSLELNFNIKEKKVTEEYTDEMSDKYLEVINNYHYTLIAKMVKLIFVSGMRRGEVLKLKWDNYSSENSTVIIEDAKSGQDEKYYLSEMAKEIIESQRGESKVYIFEDDYGEPIKRNKIGHHASRMRDMAGLPKNYRPLHSLRHRHGTQLAKSGLNAFTIQKMMTHKDIRTTQRYIDLNDADMVDALNNIEGSSQLKELDKKIVSNIQKVDVKSKE
jgi:integrase